MTTALAQGSRSAKDVALTVVAACVAIDEALAPIIGPRGVDALFKRCVHMTAKRHAWLSAELGAATDVDHDALEAVLARQTRGAAAAAGAALLLTFKELLASLVGPSLGERLLRSVWIHYFGESPAPDTSP